MEKKPDVVLNFLHDCATPSKQSLSWTWKSPGDSSLKCTVSQMGTALGLGSISQGHKAVLIARSQSDKCYFLAAKICHVILHASLHQLQVTVNH